MDKKSWKLHPEKEKSKKPWWKFESVSSIALALGALFSIGAGAWYHFTKQSNQENEVIPTLAPEEGPSKIRPENAEETHIQHEDKLIYNQISPLSSSKDSQKENILPDPETPLPVSEYIQENNISSDTKNAGETSEENAEIVEKNEIILDRSEQDEDEEEENGEDLETIPLPPGEENQNTPEGSVKTPDTKGVEPLENENEIKGARSEEQPTVPLKNESSSEPEKLDVELRNLGDSDTFASQKSLKAKNGYRVQIAAVKTPQQAQQVWDKAKQLPFLKNQPVHIKKVDLGATKGIFYRVQVGQFLTHTDAQIFCQQLRNAGKDCFIVKY